MIELMVFFAAIALMMVAAPQRGTLTLEEVIPTDMLSELIPENIKKEIYISDVANANITFDGGAGAGAGSPVKFTVPFLCRVKDIAIATGLTDTTKMALTRNGQQTGDIARYADHLNSLNNRPPPGTIYQAGEEIGGIQLA